VQVYQYENWGHDDEDLYYSLLGCGTTYTDRLGRGAYLSQFNPHNEWSRVHPKRRQPNTDYQKPHPTKQCNLICYIIGFIQYDNQVRKRTDKTLRSPEGSILLKYGAASLDDWCPAPWCSHFKGRNVQSLNTSTLEDETSDT
jgi:hypothetical protein